MPSFFGPSRTFIVLCLCQTLLATPTFSESAGSAKRLFPEIGSHEFGLFPGAGGQILLRDLSWTRRSELSAQEIAHSGGSVSWQLKSLIAYAEAGRAGYDAVHYRAPPLPRRPTAMTVREIYDWIAATPGRSHAIGRYQFIPKTLRRLMNEAEIPPDTQFSPALQDHLAEMLLEEAGMSSFLRREMNSRHFMDNLALIWAGLPSSSGFSAYHGYAGNRATITRAEFESAFARIFQ